MTGQVFALGTAPTGDWAGQADMLALREGTGWMLLAPQPGWSATLTGSAEQRIWDGAAWRVVACQSQKLDGLGVNTSSDATNRLAVSAPATLLTHEGADHRLILNKAGAAGFWALSLNAAAEGLWVGYGSGSILLEGLSLSDQGTSDFLFA